mgnify:CR=1 FL=1|jgi:NTP pyrophosphatase (non-canonical NTP hydrolase)
MEIKEFAKEVHQNAVNHGWYSEPRSFGEVIALMHSELSEALEEYRDGHETNITYYSGKTIGGTPRKPEGVPTELADCIIRILDTCVQEGIDIEKALMEKHEYNKSRSYRHGGKKI